MLNNNGIFTLKEFYNRGVVKLAPDVLVYIGGSLTTTVIAPINSSNNNLNFSDGITSVSVQNNVDPPGSSSASIEILTPIYGENSKYWTTYQGCDNHPYNRIKAPIFMPMLEVKIYFKGRFLVDMRPRYYAAFWGFINNIEESYTGGLYKITLSCADILHWWAYSTINVHPIPASNIMAGGEQILTAFSTVFERSNPFGVIYDLTEKMGMQQFVTAAWPAQKTSLQEIYPPELFVKAAKGLMSYWQQRFKSMGGLLKMYGLNGKRVDKRGIQTIQPFERTPDISSNSDVFKATTPINASQFTTDINFIKEFQIFADYQNMGNFEAAEYTTKLEIATEIKNRCEYEFFQDTNGNFIFKPPFYNLNVKGLIPYTVLPSDIINYSFNTDIEGIITVLTLNTVFDKNLQSTTFGLGKGFHMDIDLAKRYGVRYSELTLQYITDEKMAKSLAVGHMGRINAKTINGSVTIPGRPEIRLGYPVYVEHRDSFHYVKSINHSFDFGGSFITTLALETERRQVAVPDRAISLTETTTNKNKVYRYAAPLKPEAESEVSTPTESTVPSSPLLGLGGQLSSEEQKLADLNVAINDLNNRIKELSDTIQDINRNKNDQENKTQLNSLYVQLKDLNSQKSNILFSQGTIYKTWTVESPAYIAAQKEKEKEVQNNQHSTITQDALAWQRDKNSKAQGDALAADAQKDSVLEQIYPTDPKSVKRQELLIAAQKIASDPIQGLYKIDDMVSVNEISVTGTTIPYSDEDGYKVIGSFPYGRNLNPIIISNEIEDVSSKSAGTNMINLKNIYLATMARPIWKNESAAMEPLFFDNKEGAVPAYINDGPEGIVPNKLGIEEEVSDTLLSADNDVSTPEDIAEVTPVPESTSNWSMLPVVNAKPFTSFAGVPLSTNPDFIAENVTKNIGLSERQSGGESILPKKQGFLGSLLGRFIP